jgi:hypothetical protein
MRNSYPSDITKEQFETIRPLLIYMKFFVRFDTYLKRDANTQN